MAPPSEWPTYGACILVSGGEHMRSQGARATHGDDSRSARRREQYPDLVEDACCGLCVLVRETTVNQDIGRHNREERAVKTLLQYFSIRQVCGPVVGRSSIRCQ